MLFVREIHSQTNSQKVLPFLQVAIVRRINVILILSDIVPLYGKFISEALRGLGDFLRRVQSWLFFCHFFCEREDVPQYPRVYSLVVE